MVLILYISTQNLDKARFYAPTPGEMQQAALPLAKGAALIEDYLKLPGWVHDVATSGDDIVTLGMVMVSYLDRIGVLDKMAPMYRGLADRMQHGEARRVGDSDGSIQPSNGTGPDIANIPGIGSAWAPT